MDAEPIRERVKVSFTLDLDVVRILGVQAQLEHMTRSEYLEGILRANLTMWHLLKEEDSGPQDHRTKANPVTGTSIRSDVNQAFQGP